MTNSNTYGLFLILLTALCSSSCGGGGGSGGTSPQPSDEVSFELNLDGPGDPDNFFPMDTGNIWVYQGTESAASTTEYQSVQHIPRTIPVDGFDASVFYEAVTLDSSVSESWLYKDLNGIASLGTSSTDPVIASLINYWEVKFPLQPGTSYVQLDRKGLDFFQDLDADGKSEHYDIYSTVTVTGFERISTSNAVYDNALHLQRDTTMSVTLSASHNTVTVNMLAHIYNMPRIGSVFSRTTITTPAGVETDEQELAAYRLIDGRQGFIKLDSPVLAKNANQAGSKDYLLIDVTPGTDYVVSLAGITGNADLVPLIPILCGQSYIKRAGALAEECRFTASGSQAVFAVNTLENSDYIVSIAPYTTSANPQDEVASISVDTPTPGQVGPRGYSRYATTGLSPGNHTVSISGLNADADLRVYLDETYSFELDCTLKAPGDVLNEPGDCIVENTNAVYFDVRSGELNETGATYTILVH